MTPKKISLDKVAEWATKLAGNEAGSIEILNGTQGENKMALGYTQAQEDGTTHSLRVTRHAIFPHSRWHDGSPGHAQESDGRTNWIHAAPHQPTLYRTHFSVVQGHILVGHTRQYSLFIPWTVTLVGTDTPVASDMGDAIVTLKQEWIKNGMPEALANDIVNQATELFVGEAVQLAELAYGGQYSFNALITDLRLARRQQRLHAKRQMLYELYGFQSSLALNGHQLNRIISGAMRYLGYLYTAKR